MGPWCRRYQGGIVLLLRPSLPVRCCAPPPPAAVACGQRVNNISLTPHCIVDDLSVAGHQLCSDKYLWLGLCCHFGPEGQYFTIHFTIFFVESCITVHFSTI